MIHNISLYFLRSSLALLILFFANCNMGHAIQTSFFTGNVYDAYNNSAINDAVITVSNGISLKTTNGKFYINVPPNMYDVYVHARGYRSNIMTGIFAPPGKTVNMDFGLIPASTETVVFRGLIIDLINDFKGVDNAFIITNLGGMARTGQNGFFKMITPAGISDITILADGYKCKTIQGFKVSEQAPNNMIFFIIPSYGNEISISGIVRDSCTGTGVPEASLLSQTDVEYSSSNGSFSIGAVSGLSTLLATAAGYQFCLKVINSNPLSNLLTHEIKLMPSKYGFGLINGVILDSLTMEPVSMVRVESNTGAITFSRDNGSYKLYTSYCSSRLTLTAEGFRILKTPVSVTRGTPTTLNLHLDPHVHTGNTLGNDIKVDSFYK